MLVEIILLVFTASICEGGYGGGGYHHNPHGYVHQAPHWPSEDWSEKPKVHTGYGVSGIPQFDHSSPEFYWGFHQGHGETFHHNPQQYVHQQPQQYANHQHQQYDNHQHWQYQNQHQQYENQHRQYENQYQQYENHQHQQYQNKHPQYENQPQQNVNQPQGNENQPQQNVNQPVGNENQPQGNENQPQQNVNQPLGNVNQPQENVNQPQENVNQPEENVNQSEENTYEYMPPIFVPYRPKNKTQPQQNENQPQQNKNQPQQNVNQTPENKSGPQQNVNQPQQTESSTSPSTSSSTSAPLLDAPVYIQSTDNSAASRVSEKKCYSTYFPGDFFIAVAGGEKAKPGEFPYMAAIGYRISTGGFDYQCGGTLISENYILTAAHCRSVNGQTPAVARIGGARLDDNAPENQPQEITDVMVHPDYNRRQVYNDIALLKLKNASSINPACLWTKADINYNTATVIGYGQTGFGLSTSNDLITVDLQLYSSEVCKSFYAPRFRVERGLIDSQVCAGDFNKVRDTCPGDSGGPLLARTQVRDKEIPFVLGVTSFGPGCAEGTPGVYTSVFPYLDWIEPIVWPGE